MVICCGTGGGVVGAAAPGGGRPGHDGVLGHLLHAADEEAALVLDGQRAAQKFLRRLARLPGGSYGQGHYQHSHKSGTSHEDLLKNED